MGTTLSASKFIRNNKKQAGVIMLAIAVSFLAMYVVNFLITATQESFKPFMLEAPKRVAYLELEAATLSIRPEDYETTEEATEAYHREIEKLTEKLKTQEGITDAYYTQLLQATCYSVVGMMGYNFPLVEAEKIPAFLEHTHAVLKEGRMPQGEGEILVDKTIAQNNHFQIGDVFFENYYGETFRIVGILDSKGQFCVGTPHGYTNAGWAIVVLCNEQTADMEKVLAEYGITVGENDTIDDLVHSEKMYQKEVADVIGAAMLMLSLVVIIFLSVAVLVAYVSFLRSRVEEYCLYVSLGYSRREVYGMMMREVLLLFGGSILAGMAGSGVLCVLLGKWMLDPMGLKYRYWNGEYLLVMAAAYVAMIGVLQIPILGAISGIRTMDRIEEQ